MTCLRWLCVFSVILMIPSPAVSGDFQKGEEAFRNKDYKLAIAYASAIIREYPTNSFAYNSRGLAYSARHEYDKAIDDFNTAIRLYPAKAQFYANRATAHASRKARLLGLKDGAASCGRVSTSRSKRDYDKAIKDVSELIRLHPKQPDGYYLRGLAYSSRRDQDRAIKDLSEAIRLNPKSTHAYLIRGRAYLSNKNYHPAVKDFRAAIRLDPKESRGYADLAWVLATCPKAEVRQGKKAPDYAGKACELTTWTDAFALDGLAAAYAANGRYREAVKWQKKAFKRGHDDKEEEGKARKRLKLYEQEKPYRDE